MKILIITMSTIFLTACLSSVPKLKECEVPPTLLVACDDPYELPKPHTNADERTARVGNAGRLKQCKLKHQDTLKVIDSCNKGIEEHNKRIDEINK